jgi:uncharacterized protein (DUF4415 family)
MKEDDAICMKDGSAFTDLTDYARLATQTEEELLAEALTDPDVQPLTDERLRSFRPLPETPAGNFLDRVRELSKENKTPITLRVDADVARFFRAQGKGYQRLMNTVLRAYMEASIARGC